MEEVKSIQSYQQFKQRLDQEIKTQSLSFIKTGYLLKIARDTEILRESGYKNVTEFAQAEYGLTKDVVSRYIAINDRYSESGYSEMIAIEYKDYGVAKLAEMLTLSDAVVESLSPQLTKEEIKIIKEEIKEENQKLDLEVMLENRDKYQKEMTPVEATLFQIFFDNPDMFCQLSECINQEQSLMKQIEIILDVMAPSGIAVIMTRIKGVGKMMLSIKGKDSTVEILNVRTNEKESLAWQQMIYQVKNICKIGGEKAWEEIYGQAYPIKKVEVAPVQQKTEQKQVNTQSDKQLQEKKVDKKKEKQKRVITPKKEEQQLERVDGEIIKEDESDQQEEQLPGQVYVEDYPKLRIEDMQEGQAQKIDKKEMQRKNKVSQMKGALNVSFSNLQSEIKNCAWKAAEASAKHVIYYIEELDKMEEADA